MKKNNLCNVLILSALIFIPNVLWAEEPEEKKETTSTLTVIDSEMFDKGKTFTDMGYVLKTNMYSQQSNGQKYGTGNLQDLFLTTTNMVYDNIGITAGAEYYRTAWKPNSGRDVIYKYRGITLGGLYGDQTESGIGYYAGLNINAGYNTDKYFSYNMGGYEQQKESNFAAGYEIYAGIMARTYDNRNILTRLNVDYDRFTNFYDTYNNIDAQFCIEATTVAEFGCDDFYCKTDDEYDFLSLRNNHQRGNFYVDSYNPVWISFGSEKNKYDNGNISSSQGNFSAGFDVDMSYYVVDNVKLKGGAKLDLYRDHSKDDDSKYKSSDFSIILGGGINTPTQDWLNNLSANGEIEIGKSSSESTDYMGNVSYSNSDLKFRISGYVRWELPLTDKVSGYLDAGLQRQSYSDTNSDNSYNQFGPFAEVGFTASFNSFRSF